MATKFSPCKGSYVLNQFPSNVMFGMNGFLVSASGAIQGHHGPLVVSFNLASANALNLVWSKLLSCGNEITKPTSYLLHETAIIVVSSCKMLSKICSVGKG